MKDRFTILLALIVIISLVGGLSACDSDDEESTSTPTSEPTLTAQPTEEPQPSGVPSLPKKGRLRVATTTSLYDTGLWGYLEPMFEKQYGVELDVLYAGTGIALEYGQRGDVDVITVHDKAREETFVADGNGVERVIFAYNYFVIVGPADDPAGIEGMTPEDALKTLAETGATPFISRGDDSGTHAKEKSLWASAGYKYDDIRTKGWYVEAGTGMGPTLSMASEKKGYTLSDIGTFLAYKAKTGLVPIVDEGSSLLNVYAVMVCTKTKSKEMAQNMVTFLTSEEIQKLIGEYGVADFGQPLFTPCAGQPEPTS
ncbi:MAG: tungsten ABC transporter substrate-binding protein [Chloroflexi bacterium]|nr:tungsten ABC transporter substrate-binding protein [Chloroflexota bacterium]